MEAGRRLGLGHQLVHADAGHSWVHFVYRIPGGAAERDRVSAALARLGVGTKAYFLPLHSTGGDFGRVRVDGPTLATTNLLGEEALAVPMSSELNDEMVDRICIALESVLS